MNLPVKPRAFKPTKEQEACLRLDSNLAVVAGAGSGKTRVLVDRYIKILEHFKEDNAERGVDNILALTFTEKAALEMKERVRAEVMSRPDTDTPYWIRVMEDLSDAHIGTIHSFCSRLLRSYPVEAGLDFEFRLMDEADSGLFLEDGIHALLSRLVFSPGGKESEHQAHAALTILLQRWSLSTVEKELIRLCRKRRQLKSWLERVVNLRPDDLFTRWKQCLTEQQFLELDIFFAQPRVRHTMETIISIEPVTPGDSLSDLLAEIKPHLSTLRKPGKYDYSMITALYNLKTSLLTGGGKACKLGKKGQKKNWDMDELTAVREAASELAVLYARFPVFTLKLTERDREAAPFTLALAQVVSSTINRLAEERRQTATLDFDDLIEAALKLLQYEPIRNRLANRYRFIMIDEFQDTNELQWSLLSALARTTEGKLYSDRIFIVGDEKQSIYGFRGADVTVFENVRKEFAGTAWQMASSTQDETERPEIIRELSINFRTLPNPLDFVNALFRTIFPPDRKKCPQRDVPFQRLQCHRRMTEQAAGSVEILLPVKNKEGWAVKEQARLIARRIKVAVESPGDGPWALTVSEKGEPRPARYDDVAVLLRRRSFLPDLEEALRHEAVPFTVYAGIGYYQRQEIMDVLNALRFIADPTDDTALVGILRSPLFLLSDPTLYELAGVAKEAGGYWPGLKIFADGSTTKRYKSRRALNMIEHWIELANHISVSELIETIAGDSGFWTDLGLDTRGGYPVGNIEKLVRLADKWTRQKHVPLNEFVRHLDRLVKHQPREGEADPPKSNANAVQIMTIHAAKGLEFPLVFVPELDFRIQTSSSDRVYTLPGFGLGLKVEDPEQEFAEIDTAVRAMMKDSMRKNGLFEAKRLFYVALTRAKDHLILAAETQPAGKNKHWSEPPEKNEVRTWLDWLYPHLPDEEKLRDSLSPLYFTMHDGKNVIPVTIIGSLSQIPAPVPLSPSTDRPPEPSPEAYRFEHLRRVHKQTKRVVLAPTDLVKFEECPMKFVAVKGLGFDLGSLECIGAGDASQSHGDQESGSDGGKQKLDPLTRGNLAHGLLEYIDETYRNNTSLETLVEDVLSKGEIESYSHYPRRLKRAYLLKTGKEFMASRLYEELKKTTPGENKSEVPFTLAIGKALVHGRIDRLFSRGNRWQVLDYKTDSLDIDNLETSTSGRIFHHRPQMLLYSLAVQRGLKLPSESVAASLFFTTIMEEREVPLEQGEKCIISQTEDACRALEETWRSEANVYSDTDLIFERKPAAERLLFHLKDRLEGLFPQRFSLVPVERCGNCPLVHLCRRTI